MNFSNKAVTRTFASSNSQNCWGYLATIGWRRIKTGNDDGSTNMFLILNAAKASGKTVSGTIEDSTSQITILYLN